MNTSIDTQTCMHTYIVYTHTYMRVCTHSYIVAYMYNTCMHINACMTCVNMFL